MAWAHVQSAHNNVDSGSSSMTVAFGGSVTAGDLLVISTTWDSSSGATSAPTVTDSVGTSYSLIGTAMMDTTHQQGFAVLYGLAGGTGANTATITYSGGTAFMRACASEYSGIASTSTLVTTNQVVQGTASTATDNATTPTATPTATGQLVFGAVCAVDEAATYTPGTGFTERQEDASTTGARIEHEDRSAPSTSAIAAKWTLSGSTAGLSALVAIFALAGGGGGSPTVKNLAALGVG